MVLSSNEIAQMQGAYQGSVMGNMMHAGMIGGPSQGESIASAGMNVMGAMAPLGVGAMEMAGIGPMSMGMSGAMSGARFGLGGAIAGGLGGFALGAGAVGAVGAVGSQMFQGAQQQQALNASMRSNYGFVNQFGGRGFTNQGMAQIGQTMRGMTQEAGPGGEIVGFEELGRLASNMGRMGMAQGVRSAKEFTDKFREMVKTLKVVATEMGTSLEEAQKMMAGMKGSGIFNQNQAMGAVSQMRNIGGLGVASPEMTGMMSVGSQISRSVGGFGASGAQGGLETIANIAGAQRAGVINEQMIYNATGLTGAEGRRALGMRQMSRSAQFLRSGIGRRFVAAMAGEDGTLDEEDADAFMQGGVGTDETMRRAHKNLRGTGRANFIRNEGRIRGEILRKFGGLAEAAAYKNWLEERGVDVNSDRARLMIQRRTRMGRDETDVMMAQIQNMPQIMLEREQAGIEQQISRSVQRSRSSSGLRGLQKDIDKFVNKLQGDLQQAGSDLLNDLTDSVDSAIARLTGQRAIVHRGDVMRGMRSARLGGARGEQALTRLFGTGEADAELMNIARDAGLVGGGDAGVLMKEFDRSGDQRRMEAFGFKTARDFSQAETQMQSYRRINMAVRSAGKMNIAESAQSQLLALTHEITGKGLKSMSGYRDKLDAFNALGGQSAAFAKRFKEANSDAERMAAIASLNKGLGRDITDELTGDDISGDYMRSGAATVADYERSMGAMLVSKFTQAPRSRKPQVSIRDGATFRDAGAEADAEALAKEQIKAQSFIQTDEGMSIFSKLVTGSAAERSQVLDELKRGGTGAGRGFIKTMDFFHNWKQAEASAAGASDTKRREIMQDAMRRSGFKGTVEEFEQEGKKVAAAGLTKQIEAGQSYRRASIGTATRVLNETMGKLAVDEAGSLRLTAESAKALNDAGGEAAQNMAVAYLEIQRSITGISESGAGAADVAIREARTFGEFNETLAGMTGKEQMKLLSGLRGQGLGGLAAQLAPQASVQRQVEAARRRGGAAGGGMGAVAGALGVTFDRDERRALINQLKQGGTGAVAEAIAAKAGITGEDSIDAIKKAVTMSTGKDPRGAGLQITRMLDDDAVKARVQKRREEDADPAGIQRRIAKASEETSENSRKTVQALRVMAQSIDENFKFSPKPEEAGTTGATKAG